MPVDRSHDARNQAERQRLAKFVDRSDADLECDLGGGWTGATALAHVGFWDRFAHERLKLFVRDRSLLTAASPLVDVLNDGLLHQWRVLAPTAAAREALAAAEAMDAEIRGLSDETIEAYMATLQPGQSPVLLDRTRHRAEHSDQIERALA